VKLLFSLTLPPIIAHVWERRFCVACYPLPEVYLLHTIFGDWSQIQKRCLFIHLFMDIFNDSVISSDYITLNKRVIYRRHYSDYARAWGLDPGSGNVFYSRTPRLYLGSNCTVGTGVIFPGRKRPVPYVYSSPSGDEVKNESNCTSVSPIHLHELMRDSFTCLMFSAIELEGL
jgi:hypothetical protein